MKKKLKKQNKVKQTKKMKIQILIKKIKIIMMIF